jgi:Bromodomain
MADVANNEESIATATATEPPAAAVMAAVAAAPPLSKPQDPALVKMHEIVDGFLARPDSGPFREPVDWRGLELDDYPEIVKHPMDLGTVKRKLERHEYSTAAECGYDIKLIWRNCQKYNAEGSEFWILAKSFIRRFEDLFRKVRYDRTYKQQMDTMLSCPTLFVLCILRLICVGYFCR